MNIYLIEPYNAYAPKGRKKHWMEIAEEEALYHQMAQDAILQESKTALMTQNDSVQDGQTSAATQTSPACGPGGGGVPLWDYFQEQREIAQFTFSPTSGGGPLSVSFSNTTRTPLDDTFLWIFGDGDTSTDINPVHVFATGSWDIQLHATSSNGAMSAATSAITVSAPSITAGFTVTPTTGSAPFTASFTNTTTQNGNGGLTYTWQFGDVAGSTSALANPTFVYDTGSFIVRLSVSSSVYPSATASNTPTANITGTLTAVTAAGTAAASGGVAPFTTSFSNTSTQTNGQPISAYKWIFTNGITTITTASATPTVGFESGSWTGSLYATGSYGVGAVTTYTPIVSSSIPGITVNFTVDTASGAAPLNVKFSSSVVYVSSSTNPGSLTYNWDFGSGSITSTNINSTMSYSSASLYTVKLSVTESRYSIVGSKTSASFISASVT